MIANPLTRKPIKCRLSGLLEPKHSAALNLGYTLLSSNVVPNHYTNQHSTDQKYG